MAASAAEVSGRQAGVGDVDADMGSSRAKCAIMMLVAAFDAA
jgi:hypothetical protein